MSVPTATQIACRDISVALAFVSEVEKLHRLGYLHGNLSTTNVIVAAGQVHLISRKLSANFRCSHLGG